MLLLSNLVRTVDEIRICNECFFVLAIKRGVWVKFDTKIVDSHL